MKRDCNAGERAVVGRRGKLRTANLTDVYNGANVSSVVRGPSAFDLSIKINRTFIRNGHPR